MFCLLVVCYLLPFKRFGVLFKVEYFYHVILLCLRLHQILDFFDSFNYIERSSIL